MERDIQCSSEVGITVGLIDSLISIARVLVERDWSAPEADEALKDLRTCDDMHRLMDIGDLIAAKDYIEDQKKTISVLSYALALANKLAK